MDTEPRANLNELASDIARQEGLASGVGVGQVKEILALLGIRWRNMPLEDAMIEINCLISRGGKLSEHKRNMLAEAALPKNSEASLPKDDQNVDPQLNREEDGSFTLTFNDMSEIYVQDRKITVSSSHYEESIELSRTIGLEALTDGFAFYGNTFLDALPTVLFGEEEIFNPSSDLFKIKEILKIVFRVGEIDKDSFEPRMKVIVYGTFD